MWYLQKKLWKDKALLLFLARRSGVLSQIHEILHFPGFFQNHFIKKLELRAWAIAVQKHSNCRANSRWLADGSNNRRVIYSLPWPSIAPSLFFPCKNINAENFVIYLKK